MGLSWSFIFGVAGRECSPVHIWRTPRTPNREASPLCLSHEDRVGRPVCPALENNPPCHLALPGIATHQPGQYREPGPATQRGKSLGTMNKISTTTNDAKHSKEEVKKVMCTTQNLI